MFFNRVTKESVAEKPSDYDGHYVIGEAASSRKTDQVAKKIYERTFGDMSKIFCTPLEDPNADSKTGIVFQKGAQKGVAEEVQQSGHMLGMWEEVQEEDQFENINKARDENDEHLED